MSAFLCINCSQNSFYRVFLFLHLWLLPSGKFSVEALRLKHLCSSNTEWERVVLEKPGGGVGGQNK